MRRGCVPVVLRKSCVQLLTLMVWSEHFLLITRFHLHIFCVPLAFPVGFRILHQTKCSLCLCQFNKFSEKCDDSEDILTFHAKKSEAITLSAKIRNMFLVNFYCWKRIAAGWLNTLISIRVYYSKRHKAFWNVSKNCGWGFWWSFFKKICIKSWQHVALIGLSISRSILHPATTQKRFAGPWSWTLPLEAKTPILQIRVSFTVMGMLCRSILMKKELSLKAKLSIFWFVYVQMSTCGLEVRIITKRMSSWI